MEPPPQLTVAQAHALQHEKKLREIAVGDGGRGQYRQRQQRSLAAAGLAAAPKEAACSREETALTG